jgi:hypothetical protein
LDFGHLADYERRPYFILADGGRGADAVRDRLARSE